MLPLVSEETEVISATWVSFEFRPFHQPETIRSLVVVSLQHPSRHVTRWTRTRLRSKSFDGYITDFMACTAVRRYQSEAEGWREYIFDSG